MKLFTKITVGLLAGATLAIPAAASTVSAASNPANVPLTGQLVDVSTGRPVAGVTLTVTSTMTRAYLGRDVRVTTDANGRFSVNAIAIDRGYSISMTSAQWCGGRVKIGQPNLAGLQPRLVNYGGYFAKVGSTFEPRNLGAIAVRPVAIGC